jgi:GNAT superfamily N-acetyltransferase
MTASQPDFQINSDPDPQDVSFLEDRINEFNFAATGCYDAELLSIFVRDEGGAITAGIYGWTWGRACEIRFLWVHASLRGQGTGRALLAQAEAEALRRGCSTMVLDTHSFQAPGFYQKYGYQVVGVCEDYPHGHQKINLVKKLKTE